MFQVTMSARAAAQTVANGKVETEPGHTEGTFTYHEEPLPLSWDVNKFNMDKILGRGTNSPCWDPQGLGRGWRGVHLMTEELGQARDKEEPVHSKPEDTEPVCLGAWQLLL